MARGTTVSVWRENFEPLRASLLVGPNYCVLLRALFSLKITLLLKLTLSFIHLLSRILRQVEQLEQVHYSTEKTKPDSCVGIAKLLLSKPLLLLIIIESLLSVWYFPHTFQIVTPYLQMRSSSSIRRHRLFTDAAPQRGFITTGCKIRSLVSCGRSVFTLYQYC